MSNIFLNKFAELLLTIILMPLSLIAFVLLACLFTGSLLLIATTGFVLFSLGVPVWLAIIGHLIGFIVGTMILTALFIG